jgi:site-specific DNA recombinase
MTDRLTSAQLGDMFRHASGYDTMPEGWTPVGAWVRVSSGEQDEENQVPAVIRYCIDRRLWPACCYVVHAKSAFHGKHQADLDRAVADMRDGKTTILVIWHSSRLERRKGKGTSLLDTLAEFVDAGGRVESVQEPELGRNDMGGEISTFVTGLINHDKSKIISESVKLSIERSKTNGAVYNNAPWGLMLEGGKYNKQLVPAGYCRKYAPQIFDRCIDGDSLRTIAAWLDAEGVPTYRGKARWNESSVRWIIRNRVYAGRYQTRKGEPVQKCEAVVSPSTFDRANDALKTRPKRGPVSDDRPLLANLKCARCGSPMYRIKSGSTSKRLYYRCFGSGPQRKGCGNMVPLAHTDTIIAIRVFLISNDRFRVKMWVDGKSYDDEISDVKQDIREVTEAERWAELPALTAKLGDLRDKQEHETTVGHYDLFDTGITVGQHFIDLDPGQRRVFLRGYDIRVQKATPDDPGAAHGIRVVIDGEDHGVFPYPA